MIDPAEADMIVYMFSDALAGAEDGTELLQEWTENYPELGPEFAALVVDQTAGVPDGDFEAEAAGQTVLMKRLFSEMTPSSYGQALVQVPGPLVEGVDLQAASTACGIEYPAELARRLRLPAALLEKIAARRLDIGSIPMVLVQQMSSILEVGRDQVAAWLMSTPGTGSMAPAYVREEAKPYGAPTTFAAVVENSFDLDDADREYWLSILRTSRTIGESD